MKKQILVCSMFPITTPLLASEIVPQPTVKEITTRMQPSYKKQFRKRKK